MRVGIAGLGSVGGALAAYLIENPMFAAAGRPVAIGGVCARDRSKARHPGLAEVPWFDDPVALAQSPDIDVFVELIGGSDGPAKASVEAALHAGKPVVTGNKALLACHGAALAKLAETKGAPLLYEAAVMGGTPAIKMVREALVGEKIRAIAGILNGTCNYILSEMEATGRDFGDVLRDAQALGYAEADPTADVGGFDAGHKITLLAALAFGYAPDFSAAEVKGIAEVQGLDITLAKALGYRIKLIAEADRVDGRVVVRVGPALVGLDHPLARAGGALNALFIEGERIGRIFLQGPGAGGSATAAAVVADLADLLAGARRPVFSAPAETLAPLTVPAATDALERVFVRLQVKDQPGVIAAVSEALAESGVSIDSFLQRPAEGMEGVPIVLTTHAARQTAIEAAVARMAALPALLQPPRLIRIAEI